jgi:hypothetical protein
MKVFFTIFLAIFSLTILQGQNVFLNEINYISINAADRWVEVAGDAGTDLDGWYMTFHESDGTVYYTETISGFTPIDDELQGKGGIWIPIAGLQGQGDRVIILYDDMGVPKDTAAYGMLANFTGFGATLATAFTTLQGAQLNAANTAQNEGLNNYSGWSLQPSTKGDLNQNQLPVFLLTFDATLQDATAILTWETAFEKNNNHFEVQRSMDGITFSTIGNINGSGTTTEPKSYEFTDYYPMNGTNHYRLKQVSANDESYTFENLVLIESQSDFVLTVAPNPIQKGDNLKIITNENLDIIFVLYDLNGRIIKSYPNIGNQTIDISGLSAGIYVYQLWKGMEMIKVDRLVILQD